MLALYTGTPAAGLTKKHQQVQQLYWGSMTCQRVLTCGLNSPFRTAKGLLKVLTHLLQTKAPESKNR